MRVSQRPGHLVEIRRRLARIILSLACGFFNAAVSDFQVSNRHCGRAFLSMSNTQQRPLGTFVSVKR